MHPFRAAMVSVRHRLGEQGHEAAAMGKKKKKKRSGKTTSRPPNLARKAAEHLAAGRFRQAVDAYKKLYKTDRDGYRASLKAAYEGLYRQRIAKGLLEEAAMVVAQIEALSGEPAFDERLRLCLKRQDFAQAAHIAGEALCAPDRFSTQEMQRAADVLVVAFDPVPAERALPPNIFSDLDRIRAALKSVAGESWQEALDKIKPIGTRSVFASWKLFIKGLCAFYGQEDEKALTAFSKVPAASAAAAAAAPYQALLRNNPGQEAESKDTRLATGICVVAGYGAVAADLARAEYLWTVKRFRDSHIHLQRTIEDFPICSRGLTRSLTTLYYNACFEMPPRPAQKYIAHLVRSAFNGGADTAAAQLWAQRSLALYSEDHEDSDAFILDQWEKFIALYESLNGDSPRVRSLVYARLGDIFSIEMPDDDPFSFFFFRRRRKGPHLRNEEMAQLCYQKSVDAAPAAMQPQLAQVVFFEKIGAASSVNRLLDKLIRQFPDEKEVLVKAGVRCTERKAFVKAMRYLDRALALDPMDKDLRENFIVTCIRAARQYSVKANPKKARALLLRALEWADTDSDHFNRGPACLYVRWTAMAQIYGDEADARQWWAQAVDHWQGSALKQHFFYWSVARAYGVAPRFTKESEALVAKALKGAFCIDTALDCIRTLQYAHMLPDSIAGLQRMAERLERYLHRGATADMTRQQAGEVVSFALSETCDRPDIAKAYIRCMLKRNPDDALFRYYRYLAGLQTASGLSDIDAEQHELNAILRLAREQNETKVTLAVQKLLHEIEAMEPPDAFDGNPFLNFLEDFEEEDLPADDDDFQPFFPSPPRKTRSKKKAPPKKSGPRGPEQMELF